MAAKKKKPDLEFMEAMPLEDEDDDEELDELDDEDVEDLDDEELDEGDLDDEGMMLAETVLGDGDMATRAQALRDFVKHCMSSGDGY